MSNPLPTNKSVVSFVYQGGTRKGEVRHVYIFNNKGDGGNVICWDFEQGAVRKYDPRKIESVAAKQIMVKAIDVSLLPSFADIFDGEDIAAKLRSEGKWAVWDKDTNLITVVERPKTAYLDAAGLLIRLKRAELSIENGNGGLYIWDNTRGMSYLFTPEKLVELIQYYN